MHDRLQRWVRAIRRPVAFRPKESTIVGIERLLVVLQVLELYQYSISPRLRFKKLRSVMATIMQIASPESTSSQGSLFAEKA